MYVYCLIFGPKQKKNLHYWLTIPFTNTYRPNLSIAVVTTAIIKMGRFLILILFLASRFFSFCFFFIWTKAKSKSPFILFLFIPCFFFHFVFLISSIQKKNLRSVHFISIEWWFDRFRNVNRIFFVLFTKNERKKFYICARAKHHDDVFFSFLSRRFHLNILKSKWMKCCFWACSKKNIYSSEKINKIKFVMPNGHHHTHIHHYIQQISMCGYSQ